MQLLYIDVETLHKYERNRSNYFFVQNNQLIEIKENDYLILNTFKTFGFFQENEIFMNQLLDLFNELGYNFKLNDLKKLINNLKEKSILVPIKAETEIISLMKINRVPDCLIQNELNKYLLEKYNVQVYDKFILNNCFLINSHLTDELYKLMISIVNYHNYENKIKYSNLIEKIKIICSDENTPFKEYTEEEIISVFIDLIGIKHLKINE